MYQKPLSSFLIVIFLSTTVSVKAGTGGAKDGLESRDLPLQEALMEDDSGGYFDSWTPERKELAVTLGIVAGVSIYGFVEWGWGSQNFTYSSEGWFGQNTKYGGADKLGHAYTGAVITAVASSLYRHIGMENENSARMGAFAGLLSTTVIEIGDGFSEDHGFSWEDQFCNMAGVGLEYLRQRHPEFARRLQFRWEYFPSSAVRSGGETDIATDYDGSRWMLAFPLQAWLGDDAGWLGWFDVLVGYGTRGYTDDNNHRERHPFVGIGLSLPRAKEHFRIGGPERVLEYVQVPGTAWPLPP